MASSSTIVSRIEGLDRARGRLRAVIKAERDATAKALELVGQQATGNVRRRRAPWRTGDLLRSYDYAVEDDHVDVGSNLEYAPYQEFGTRYIAGTPHLRPAIEETVREVPAIIAEAVGRAGRMGGA